MKENSKKNRENVLKRTLSCISSPSAVKILNTRSQAINNTNQRQFPISKTIYACSCWNTFLLQGFTVFGIQLVYTCESDKKMRV